MMIYAFEPANAGGQIASWKPVHSHLFAHDDRLEPLYLDERQSLVDALRGQHVRIPDLQSLFQTWPEATSPEIPTLRLQIEQTLERCVPQISQYQCLIFLGSSRLENDALGSEPPTLLSLERCGGRMPHLSGFVSQPILPFG